MLHIPRSSLPIPVKAFWSLTMYDSESFFVPNPLNRYVINSRSHLHKNADGSIDLYVQHDRPSEPGAGHQLVARARGGDRLPLDLAPVRPRPSAPRRARRLWLAAAPVQPCDAAGHAAGGTTCAS